MGSKQKLLSVAAAIVIAVLAYFAGYFFAERKQYGLIEKMASEQLGYHLAMLQWIDANKTDEARRLLQASTNRQLGWIIEYGHLNTEPEYIQQRCNLINKLKTYRKEHKLFETSDWDYLWKVPGNRAAEDRRVEFLENACNT